jgi:hypothetical protein
MAQETGIPPSMPGFALSFNDSAAGAATSTRAADRQKSFINEGK